MARTNRHLTLLLCLLLCGLTLPALSPAQSGVIYVYDDLGRLVGVVDPQGNAAVYNYDAVGNLLSISRYSSTQVSIIRFTPASGSVGTSVTIYGSNFSATPGQNTVTFNGTSAPIVSATATQIVATVPAGATTGTITVTSPTGTATSAKSFTVTSGSASGGPTISSFSPTLALSGAAVTITGTNFDPVTANNLIRFGPGVAAPVTTGTTTSLPTSVPPGAFTGHISVAAPSGSATSSGYFFVPPSPHVVADVGYTGSISMGQSQAINTLGANQIALLAFDATVGQQVSVLATNVTNTGKLTIFSPGGTNLGNTGNFTSSDGFLDTITLPSAGTYTIMPETVGSPGLIATVTLYNAQPVTAAITPSGAAVPVSISTPGQTARLTFSGTAGRQVSFLVSNETVIRQPQGSCCTTWVTFLKPDGTTLSSTSFSGTSGFFVDSQTLPSTGTYTIIVDPAGALTFSANYTLYDSTDITGTITPTATGTTVTPNTTAPGQNARYTFSGNSGDRISLNAPTENVNQATISILNPDGSTLASGSIGTSLGIYSRFIDVQTLASTGTYTVLFDPSNTNTGGVTLTLYSVPADVSGSLTINGTAQTVAISTPGQNARLSFTGNAGQQVTLHATGNNMTAGGTVKLIATDGVTVLQSWNLLAASFNLSSQTLSTTGTYYVSVNPDGPQTGSITLSVTSP